MPTDESQFLHELEPEIEAELAVAQPSQPADAPGASPAEWLFDPTDLELEEIGLRNLLGAVISAGKRLPPQAARQSGSSASSSSLTCAGRARRRDRPQLRSDHRDQTSGGSSTWRQFPSGRTGRSRRPTPLATPRSCSSMASGCCRAAGPTGRTSSSRPATRR